MTRDEFRRALNKRPLEDASFDLPPLILFSVDKEKVGFKPHEKRCVDIDVSNEDCLIPEISSGSWDTLLEILSGERDLMKAFGECELATNGYVTLLYPILAMFQSGRTGTPPP